MELFQPTDVCIELCNSFRCRFGKVPLQLCDGSTIVLTFVVVVVVYCSYRGLQLESKNAVCQLVWTKTTTHILVGARVPNLSSRRLLLR